MTLLKETLRRWLTPVTAIISLMIGLVVVVLIIFSADGRLPPRIVVTTNEWDPLIGSNLPHSGPMARIVEEALTRAGYDAIFRFGKWEDGYEDAANGRVHGTFPWIWTEKRRGRFLRSEPLVNLAYALFYKLPAYRVDRTDIGRITDPEELRRLELKVGLVENYQLWGNISELVEVVSGYEDLRAAFEALERGEVDLVAEVVAPALHLLYRADNHFDRSHFDYIRFEESPLTASDQDWHLLTSAAGGEEFIVRFNEGLAKFKETPLYSELVDSMEAGPDERIRLISAPAEARDPLEEERRYLLPAGTQASVIRWPAAFDRGTDSARLPNESLWCDIVVLNGPQRGRVLEVRADEIELVNRD